MKLFLGTIFLACVLSAIAAVTPISHLPNGCVVVAREYEAERLADRSLREHKVWAHVLLFKWKQGWHGVCIFTMSNGDVWSYDHVRGSNSLNTQNQDIASITVGLEVIYGHLSGVRFVD